jgi:hypothetical protein
MINSMDNKINIIAGKIDAIFIQKHVFNIGSLPGRYVILFFSMLNVR